MALESNTAGIQVNSLVTPQKPLAYTCITTTANTTLNNPSAVVELIPAQTKGARFTKITALGQLAKTSELQLFTSTNSGTDKRYIDSATMTATVSTTAKQTKATFGFSEADPLILAAGENLYVGQAVGSGDVTWRAEGGGYV